MPWNGSGTFTLNQNFPADRDAGAPDHFIDADKMDDELQNVKGGLENCLTRDGQTVPSANTPWNAKKITGLADATNATDALNRQTADARYAQLAGDTFTGQVVFANGSAAAPGFTFASDASLNSGWYWKSENAIAASTAGVERFAISNAGAALVGTFSVTGDPTAGDHVGDRDYNDARYCLESNNLSDLDNAATARTNLGLGSIATQAASNVAITGGAISGITDLAVADGGTGASNPAGARSNLGIGSMATRAYTASTAAPTGGSDGDVWFRYQ